MSITTVTARDFARDLAQAKRAAESGPVIVTDRGQPTYALLKISDYYRLTGAGQANLLDTMDALRVEAIEGDIDFDPPSLNDLSLKPAEL